jgi:hypothetical protein
MMNPAMRSRSTSVKVPGVKPVTWRGTSRGSMSFDASSRSSVVSLVPPSDGIPIRLPTSALGSLSGRSLCDTIASGERQPVNATLVMGRPGRRSR